MTTITRHYVYVGERRVHYRRAGEGPPLVVLHSCPGSSASMEAVMAPLARQHTVIALDNPGFGESAGVGRALPAIGDYALALAETLDVLGLAQIDLFGFRTGAKIALDFALQRPGRVRRLALEGFAHYTPQETVEMFAHYTPDLTPRADGGHVLRTWAMWRDVQVWWPWFDQRPETRIARPLAPPRVLHAQVVDFLRAGKDYWQGYHAAFRYPGPEALRRLSVPTLLFATSTDPLRLHLPRLGVLPAHVTTEVVPAGANARLAAAERLVTFFAGSSVPSAPPAPGVLPAATVRRDYAQTRVGQLLVRRAGERGAWLVLLHDLPGSGALLEPLLAEFAAERRAVAIDLPGAGDSAALPDAPTLDDVAGVLAEAIDALGIETFDLYGAGLGAPAGVALAARLGARVGRLILDRPRLDPVADFDREFPLVEPTTSGSHLIDLWCAWRDRQLWSPPYERTPDHAVAAAVPDPETLHAGFLEVVKAALTVPALAHAVGDGSARDRLAGLEAEVVPLTDGDRAALAGGEKPPAR
jgi:pimeloyl-ACP methyl ester carboxylesterase